MRPSTQPITMYSDNGTDEVASIASDSISLDDEIDAIVADTRAPINFLENKVDARISLQHLVTQYWSDATVKLYGSFAYDLATSKSELDLVVEGCTPCCGDILTNFMAHLKKQTVSASETKAWECLSLIVNQTEGFARIRIESGLVINLSFTVDIRCPARKNAALIKSLLQKYPTASRVYFVIRHLMIQRGLCVPNEGGMSHYGMLIMLLHVCANETCPEVLSNPTMLMMAYLRFYGLKINFHTITVSAFRTSEPHRNHTQDVMSIADPSDPSVNLAQSCTKAVEIKTSMQRVYDLIKQREKSGKGPSLLSMLSKGKSKKWRAK